jgi:ribosomal-protein-alanine N-acetyltransferase
MIRALLQLFARGEPVLTEASARDAEAISKLHSESFIRGWTEDEVESLLTDRAVLAHRATTGRTLSGFIMSRVAAGEAEILSVAVDKSARGRGLARRLLMLHLGRLAGLGVRTIFLEVDETNESARRLYGRAGFRPVGTRKDYYQKGTAPPAAALVLRRDLA